MILRGLGIRGTCRPGTRACGALCPDFGEFLVAEGRIELPTYGL